MFRTDLFYQMPALGTRARVLEARAPGPGSLRPRAPEAPHGTPPWDPPWDPTWDPWGDPPGIPGTPPGTPGAKKSDFYTDFIKPGGGFKKFGSPVEISAMTGHEATRIFFQSTGGGIKIFIFIIFLLIFIGIL